MDKNSQRNWLHRLGGNLQQSLRWLTPGLGVKRWLLLILFGITLLGVGLAIVILDVYRTTPDTWWLPFISAASLRFLPRLLRALIFGSLGVAMIVGGIWGINRSLMAPFLKPGYKVVDELAGYRRRGRGPRIVVIGGGHGLSVLIRGLKSYTNNITAIVTVADDGGSSGKLRKTFGILPPGDMRNCLSAMSNDEAMLTQLFQYRFPNGSRGLDGHSFGNLFISALTEITGSFEEAVAESGRVLSVSGRVLPSTLHNVELVADVKLPYLSSEIRVAGESKIPESNGRVRRVWLEPNAPPAFPQAIQALLSADVIVIGPGSLYTSLLPNLLVPDIADAIRSSRALKLYICNVASQAGETEGFSCIDHISAIEEHSGKSLFDIVIANNNYDIQLPEGIEWIKIDDNLDAYYAVYSDDLVDSAMPWRHDGEALSRVIIDLLEERTGSLVEL
ncbi:MAG TPA: uridine diphosphate-N-acetylglucosamine-binding protein YvcK [Anaerolineales bacterium]|nr:uridine diphosphate-N-acetylglucosamine-binding protein YvcK [Anaerolineales bacterium]